MQGFLRLLGSSVFRHPGGRDDRRRFCSGDVRGEEDTRFSLETGRDQRGSRIVLRERLDTGDEPVSVAGRHAPSAFITALPTVACAFAFAILATLVGLGQLTGVDQFAVYHLMPWLTPNPAPVSLRDGLKLYSGSFKLTDAITLIGGALPASAIAVLLAGLLVRRGRRVTAFLLVALFVVGVGMESLLKMLLTRPELRVWHDGRLLRLAGFDSSFPSGHALRVTFLAAMVVTLWPRLAPLAWLAVAVIALTLEFGGFHTPSDVAGGLLLAGVLLLVTRNILSRLPVAGRAQPMD
jgi:membrane-associated phospholipid phosphatase